MVVTQDRRRTYQATHDDTLVAIKVRPAADVVAEAEMLQLLALDPRSHTVEVVSVIEDLGFGWHGALATAFEPLDARCETDAQARQFAVDLLEVCRHVCALVHS